jgi:hypothetical protein
MDEKGPVEAVEEKVAELAHEAGEGKTARTPLLLLSGVSLVIVAAVVVLTALAFLVYWLA